MLDEGKKSLIKLIKESNPWYFQSGNEGVILENNFRSFESLSVKQLAKLLINTEKIGYAHSQCKEYAIGKEVFFGSLVDVYSPKKTKLGYCLGFELFTNNFYKDYCIITTIDHDWDSLADIMIENIRYALDKKDKEERLEELRIEWEKAISDNTPKKLAFDLRALTFDDLLRHACKNEKHDKIK